jgi:hypothetical protein
MKKLAVEEAKDMSAPVNRLVQALEAAADKATVSSDRMDVLKGELEGVSNASQELGKRLGTEVGQPLTAHGETLKRVHEQLLPMAEQIKGVAKLMEGAKAKGAGGDGIDGKLLGELSDLRKAMGETNAQLKTLIGRIDGAVVAEHKHGILGRLFGGGSPGAGSK